MNLEQFKMKSGRVNKAAVIRHLVNEKKNTFTINDLLEDLTPILEVEKRDIYFVLERLRNLDKVELVQVGTGVTPNIYRCLNG